MVRKINQRVVFTVPVANRQFGCLDLDSNSTGVAHLLGVAKKHQIWDLPNVELAAGMIVDQPDGELTIVERGPYNLFMSCSVSSSVGATEIVCRITKNGIPIPGLVSVDQDSGGANPATFSTSGFVLLEKDDVIAITLETDKNATLTVVNAIFGGWRLSVTG